MQSEQAFETTSNRQDQLDRMLLMIPQDPQNEHLIVDSATLAFELGKYELVQQISDAFAAGKNIPPELLNLRALIDLRHGEIGGALRGLRQVHDLDKTNRSFAYNLAYALTVQGEFIEALALLEDAVVAAVDNAASLKIRCLHHLGEYQQALLFGASLGVAIDQKSAAGLAMFALDLADWSAVDHYSRLAPEQPDAIMARAFLRLEQGATDDVLRSFQQVVDTTKDNGRAFVGLGLANLLRNNFLAAGEALEKGSGLLRNHLGAKVAAGWSYVLAKDLVKAQACCDSLVQAEPRFAEGQGLRAILAFLAGDLAAAKKHSERALRLDRECMSGALARILLFEAAGKAEAANALRNTAIDRPVNAKGTTLREAIALLAKAP